MTVVDVLRVGLQLELGGFQQAGHFIVAPNRCLPVHQQGQSFIEAEFFMRRGLRLLLFQAFGHAGEPEVV